MHARERTTSFETSRHDPNESRRPRHKFIRAKTRSRSRPPSPQRPSGAQHNNASLPPCLRLTRAPGVCGSSASAPQRARGRGGGATAVTARVGEAGPARGEKSTRARRTRRAARRARRAAGAARSRPRSPPGDGEAERCLVVAFFRLSNFLRTKYHEVP